MQLLWSRQLFYLRCKVYLVVLWVILASKQLFFHGSNSPFLAFILTRFWSSWKQLYWMTNHTGTNCRPMMRHPYHCPSRPPASHADMFMETVLVKNCKVSISWCMCANSVCVCVCVCVCARACVCVCVTVKSEVFIKRNEGNSLHCFFCFSFTIFK